MATPRKFSEKIALQKQKEAEGTAEFEKIMKEVTELCGPSEESRSPGSACINIASSTGSYRESRGRSVGIGPIRRTSERKVDTSPYGGTYLCLPTSDFRRVKSDPAIHNSLAFVHDESKGQLPSSSGNRNMISTERLQQSPHHASVRIQNIGSNNQSGVCPSKAGSAFNIRQSSSNLLTSPFFPDNQLSVSMANTASLPDLTSVHFMPKASINNKDHCPSGGGEIGTGENGAGDRSNNSTYSPSPTTSPATLSPHSVPPNRHQYSPIYNINSRNTYSPTHFVNQREILSTSVGSTSGTNSGNFNPHNSSIIGQTSHSFTNIPGSMHNQQQHQQSCKNFNNLIGNDVIHSSHGQLQSFSISNAQLSDSSTTEYRNPQNRPSPGSSPSFVHASTPFPGCESNPNSPLSPESINDSKYNHNAIDASPSPNYQSQQQQNNDTNSFNQQMQNHFQHFSLVDSSSSDTANITNAQQAQNIFQQLTSSNYEKQSHQHQQTLINSQQQHRLTQSNQMIGGGTGNINNRSDNDGNNQFSITLGNLDVSENECDRELSHTNNYNTTVSTPARIPEIVFTDFSSSNPDFTREIFASLDLELTPIDVEGLQMISDNSTMTDQMTEDSFREELN
ncbi:putative uncharacterized protein DDB_G0282133 [Condylostylus longicornis]|uniref:putative uncharacterized protein DDB_G0282133 n=1 Tax=Condylostylus longicornis TaxID=2530218 RepID=UPI00244DE279|nr:putative uncharacterized protein DDB_G0282133 [Condylostylus longicornis]XP_055372934.1 putative uncharacterized protein DDB_G0282133 [Condylostylus longicornis]XP_055373015.1 putative uncharacterized protein DDB_G0282133 [Condylostylus longicornis]XP_055373093.1 putative uncharacterized protein DDB_G0282133 [Condylostylus longicornis]XP_055373185.1 putative uncharacterized protein DDB_G0282133 [Condylostylus longicornis]XP_055373268.1 putative uncharacterized protein DDB_G0282133 [Condylos